MSNPKEIQRFTRATSENIADIITSILRGDKVIVDGITDSRYPYIPYTASTFDYPWPEDIKHQQDPADICGHTELQRFYLDLTEHGVSVNLFWQGIYEVLTSDRNLGEHGLGELFYALTEDMTIKSYEESHEINQVLKRYVVERTYDKQSAQLWQPLHSKRPNPPLHELILSAYARYQQGETVEFWKGIIEQETTEGEIFIAFRGLANVDVACAEQYLKSNDIPHALKNHKSFPSSCYTDAELILLSVKNSSGK
jgi:hypothetical protein